MSARDFIHFDFAKVLRKKESARSRETRSPIIWAGIAGGVAGCTYAFYNVAAGITDPQSHPPMPLTILTCTGIGVYLTVKASREIYFNLSSRGPQCIDRSSNADGNPQLSKLMMKSYRNSALGNAAWFVADGIAAGVLKYFSMHGEYKAGCDFFSHAVNGFILPEMVAGGGLAGLMGLAAIKLHSGSWRVTTPLNPVSREEVSGGELLANHNIKTSNFRVASLVGGPR